MTREQAQQIANKAMVEAGIPCTEAASKIADILMESAKPKVPFKVGQKCVCLSAFGGIGNEIIYNPDWNPAVAQGNLAPDTPEGRKQLELEARRRAFRAKPRKEGERVWVNRPHDVQHVNGFGGAWAIHLATILGLTWATREEAEANQAEAMELFWEGL